MRLFLLSLLAIGSVQSLAIRPYRLVWNNNPFFAQLPLKSGVVGGYSRYLDGSGIDRAVAYNGHDPVYAVHQFKYVPSETPAQQSFASSKFDEINFRSWITLRYQNLKHDIGILRAEGKEPTPEILTKFQTLEKIVSAPNFSTIADLPEVKEIMQDYEQAISSNEAIQSSNIKQNQGEIKTYTGHSNIPLVAIEESPETKHAREEYLRIYNEKTTYLKQLELKYQKESVKQVDNAVALAELERAKQEHFLSWATLQYENLKYDIGILRAKGKEPTPEVLRKFQTLEKIVITPNFSIIADLPEVQNIRQDYGQSIRLNEAAQSLNIKQNQGEIKTYTGHSYIPLAAIEESPETKQAREELLRNYNEKTAHLKQLILDHQKNVKEQPESVKQADNAVALAELERAQQEHIRSWTTLQYHNLKYDIGILRAKGKEPTPEVLRKFQTLEKIVSAPNFSIIADLPEVKEIMQDYEQAINLDEAIHSSNIKQNQGEIKTYTGNSNIPLVAIEESPETKQAREEHLRIYNEQIAHLKQLELEHQKNVQEQPERVKQVDNAAALTELERAQQEHFRLWNEAKLRAEQAGYDGGAKTVYESAEKQQISAQTNNQNTFNLKQNQELQSTAQTEPVKTSTDQQRYSSDSSSNDQTLFQPQQVVLRDEHSRLVDSSSFQGLKSNIPVAQQALLPQPVADTPEVIRAREEHLRIVNEAVSRAQAVQQEEEKQRQQRIEQSSVTGSDEGHAIHHLSHNVEQQQLKSEFSTADYDQQSHVVETPEVIKAREEHLRLVQEANLRAQFVEQQELKYKHQSQTPILKTQYPHEQLEYHSQISQTGVPETLDVTNAREQHSRLVTENNSKLNSDVHRSVESHGIEETPEVKRAREEHLRIYNAIKNQVEQEKSLKNERKSPEAIVSQQLGEYSTEEERLLEMERLRETERLQKEQQLLEMERMQEAERLAEEKRNMEAELVRLRIEDEQRLEMERLLELQRLQQEQEELQKLKSEGYQEIIIQDSSAYQQPQPQQIAIVTNEQSTGKSSTSNVNVQSTSKFGHNPYLRFQSSPVVNEQFYTVPLQQSVKHQQEISAFAHSPFLKSSAVNVPGTIHHHQPAYAHVNEQSVNEPSVRYVQSPQQSGGGNKHQHIKDDHYVKHKYQDNASNQPADTAEVLIALERATKEHFRAHELALEQLRLARLQNPQLKDCN